jgi:hypothetical protein
MAEIDSSVPCRKLVGTSAHPVLIIPLEHPNGYVYVRAAKPTCCIRCGGKLEMEHRSLWLRDPEHDKRNYPPTHSCYWFTLECSACGFTVWYDDGLFARVGWARSSCIIGPPYLRDTY